MMEKSSFFNSVGNDRTYMAEDWAEYFFTFIGNGVFPNPSTNLQVLASNGMTVYVGAGKAWINGYFYYNTDNLVLQLSPADGVLNRIDRVVVRLDYSERIITTVVKSSAYASNPVAPTLQRDADKYEIAVADILVLAGDTGVSQANITDKRLDSSVCGVVAGVVNQIDTATFSAQLESWMNAFEAQMQESGDEIATDMQTFKTNMQASFAEWFGTVQDALDGNTAGQLLNLIQAQSDRITAITPASIGASTVTSFPATLTTAWTGGEAPYTQEVTVNGLLATDTPIVDMVASDVFETAEAEAAAWASVYRIVAGTNKLTVYASAATETAINLQIKVVR